MTATPDPDMLWAYIALAVITVLTMVGMVVGRFGP